jgi:hypothetical protein
MERGSVRLTRAWLLSGSRFEKVTAGADVAVQVPCLGLVRMFSVTASMLAGLGCFKGAAWWPGHGRGTVP